MCREGIDLVTLKVALRHSSERIRQEVGQLRQWSALASNVNLEEIAARLAGALEQLGAGEEAVSDCVSRLAELQVERPATGGTGFTITPM